MQIGSNLISDESDAYVIAEIGHNHQGDLEKARDLFHAAKMSGVQAVKLRGMPAAAIAAEVPLVLLTIATSVDSTGAGTITLLFAGDTSIRLEVECVECHLRDLGPAWETPNRPDHGLT